ncbi:Protein tyrosine kinase [Musa troglodytarum]|uniref:non-specific serine/threonine protein kinase n=1 Tax=Musa troglodytarum TaxID=320322 RepID=A0A9E7GD23_9LILI|nr:Protein tyrosine kinase [Musa troglodytarum]
MDQLLPPPSLDLRDLKALSVLGRGAKGVVFLVRVADASSAGDALALKAVSRSSIERRASGGDAYRRVWLERDVLLSLRHPLLPSLRGVVSTERIVGFAIDRCSGGDLASLRRRQSEKMFSEDIIRFYAAELVLALEYLHGLGIVYRDLKPENVLIQDNGHLMLVDFDLSTKLPSGPPPEPLNSPPSVTPRHYESTPPGTGKKRKKKVKRKEKKASCLTGCFSFNADLSPETSKSFLAEEAKAAPPASPGTSAGKSNSFVGTEEYVAPEIIEGKGHDFAVDWWGLGVVLYEMLYGRTPFRGKNQKDTFHRILTKEADLVGETAPLRDLIRRLLEKDPERRITGEAIKAHGFFRGVTWEELLRIPRPPFIPMPSDDADDAAFEGLDVESTVDEVSAAKEDAREEKAAGGKRDEGVTAPPRPPDFVVF